MIDVPEAFRFLKRQQHDWKVTATRTSIFRLLYNMTLPYLSIYAVALGASGFELGVINSVGMGVAGVVSPITGWIIDRVGIKRIYLTGILWLAISYAIYSLAHSWPILIVAMLAYWLGFATSMHGCSVICANKVAKAERVTVMSSCETLGAGLVGLAGPMIGAFLVVSYGGLNVTGIRPLFVVALVGTVASFFLILTQLSNQKPEKRDSGLHFLRDTAQVLRQGHNLGSFLVVAAVSFLPVGMVIPFAQVFAQQVKGADTFVLGAMVTGSALTSLFLGIPAGRLADRIGRRKAIYITAPLFWLSCLMLIWAPNPFWLIVSGVFQGFYLVNAVVTTALTFELVPADQMGRWMGMVRLSRMMVGAASAFLAGLLWDKVGPQYLFLAFIALDLLVRIPLLARTGEGLDRSASA